MCTASAGASVSYKQSDSDWGLLVLVLIESD